MNRILLQLFESNISTVNKVHLKTTTQSYQKLCLKDAADKTSYQFYMIKNLLFSFRIKNFRSNLHQFLPLKILQILSSIDTTVQ